MNPDETKTSASTELSASTKPSPEELQETREQVLEQQIQLLRGDIARLKQAEEVLQERVEELEGSLVKKSIQVPLGWRI